MSVSKATGVKKRRPPLPEEIYPNLVKETTNVVTETLNDTGSTSNERLPRALPLREPVVDRRNLVSGSVPSTRYSWAADCGKVKLKTKCRSLDDINADCGKVKLKTKCRSLDDINFLSDNEALDVQRLNETVKTLDNTELHNGHKRHSSGDVSKILHDTDNQMVDQEDIITLTRHIKKFSEAFSKLRNAFTGNGSDTDSDENTDGGNEEMHVKAHRSLGNVLSNLKQVINCYPSLRSNEILAAAGNLISKVRNPSYVDNKVPDDFYHAIDQLALVFSTSISDLLMGDQEPSPNKAGDDGDDVDDFPEDGYEDDGSEGDILSDSMNLPSRQESLNGILRDKDADLDKVLLKMESGVEFCLQWTKCWSKYVKDIANYIEKRAQLEAEYTKQLTKLAQATRASISEESYLPFQSTFIKALDQDMDYSMKCQQTLAAISGSKFMEPLMQRRTVHDRARKDMKDEWTKQCRQVQDSAHSLKTCQNNYQKRMQELEKLNTRQSDVKEGSNKGKKEEHLRTKVEEAEQFYSNAIYVANEMLNEAEKIKVRIVTQTKQLVNECDRTFRSVTRKYFDMMHELAVPTPIHFKTLAESCQGYEPGKEFEDFVRFQQTTARSAVRIFYEFQHYSSSRSGNDLESPVRASLSPLKMWTSSHMSDYEGGVSPSGSPSSSPKTPKKSSRTRPRPPPSTDDESEGEIKKPLYSNPGQQNKEKIRNLVNTKIETFNQM